MIRIGDVLNDLYEVQEEIGSGGGGVVYKAYHLRLQKPVVIKLIKESVKEWIDERGEVDILKQLKHTYLPQVYDFVSNGDSVYTVMDFIPGESFDRVLERQTVFEQHRIVKWARQLSEALAYLHAQTPPIIHGDIKPANVMLTPNDDICLIDFNISLLFKGAQSSAIGFSRGYSAPELFWHRVETSVSETALLPKTEVLNREKTELLPASQTATAVLTPSEQATSLLQEHAVGQNAAKAKDPDITFVHRGMIDERSDIYSLGATLYHIALGKKPELDAGDHVIWDEEQEISDGVRYIIEKAVETRPEDRFQTAKAMLEAIGNINRLDGAYRRMVARQWGAYILLAVLLAGSVITTKVGWDMMRNERIVAYETMVIQSEQLSSSGEFSQAVELAQELQQRYPDEPGGYKAQALAYFRQYDHDACLAYLDQVLVGFSDQESLDDVAGLADLFFIKANAYFEQARYEQAIPEYQTAIGYNQENSEYYRDYAISLARIGQVVQAGEVLDAAVELGLDTASVLLVEGELALAREQFTDAEQAFLAAIQKSESEYTMERGYLVCAQVYEQADAFSDGLDQKIRLLEEGVGRLPSDKNLVLTEMLGEAYAEKARVTGNAEYYQDAAEHFQRLLEVGYSRFYILNNLAILYQNMGDFDRAEEMLDDMQFRFPDDYRVYMQAAFLYADEQARKPIEEREYSLVQQTYEKAVALYEGNMGHNATDPQMLMLEGLIGDLRDGGWLS